MAIDKEKTLQGAQRAIDRKKYDLAIEEYRKLATVEKNDPRWLLKIGDTQQKKGDFAAAIGSYEEVARFYSSQGFHLKAVAVYNTVRDLLARQAPQLQSRYAHVPIKLAELYEKLKLTSDAIATWDQIADGLQHDERDREAIDVYRRIVGLDPTNPLAHLRLAEALSRQKDTEGAIAEFAATAEQLTAQKRVDDALKVYERLLHHRQDPKYARPAAELYLARGAQNDGVAAIAKIQICLKSDPKSVELIAMLAQGFVAIGQNDKAVTIYKESARLAGDQGKQDLRRDIVKRLHRLAPNDDAVRTLVADIGGSASASVTQASTAQPTGARGQAGVPSPPARGVPAAKPPQQPTARAAKAAAAPPPTPPRTANDVAPPRTGSALAPTAAQPAARGAPPAAKPAVRAAHPAARAAPPAARAAPPAARAVPPVAQPTARAAPPVTQTAARAAPPAAQPAPRIPAPASAAAQPPSVRAQPQARATRYAQILEVEDSELEVSVEDTHEVDFEDREAAEEVGDVQRVSEHSPNARIAEVISTADAYRKSKLFAKALTTLRIGLELDPRGIAIRERIRDILIETGETDLAIGEMVTLGAILMEEDDLQGAYDNLAWILEADPGHPQATRLYERLQSLASGVSVVESDELSERPGSQPVALGRLDDSTADAPLPSYDLDEPDLPAYELNEGEEPREIPRVTGAHQTRATPLSPADSRFGSGVAEVEAALEEAEFYASQGVFETARETIEDALRASPRNPLLLERLREIEAAAAAVRPQTTPPFSDRAFDIAASLDALDQLETPRGGPSIDQIDVEEVFAKFKMGVAEQVDASDSQTHYDLGIAYEQMMLYDDAIQEFRVASRDPMRLALCQSMIAMIFEKKGQLTEATDAYKAGLVAEHLTQDEELALLYQLGDISERRKNKKDAAHYFKRVVSGDPRYRDAKRRLQGIEAALIDKGSGARSKKEIDELDSAFDDVLDTGTKKKSN